MIQRCVKKIGQQYVVSQFLAFFMEACCDYRDSALDHVASYRKDGKDAFK